MLEWIRRVGAQARTFLFRPDPVLAADAQRMGIKVWDPDEVFSIGSLVRAEGGDAYIVAPLNMPFREDWLLDEVEAAMASHPGCRVETASELSKVPGSMEPDGCLEGRPVALDYSADTADVFVPHHGACRREMVTLGDIFDARYWRALSEEVGRYPRLAGLSGTVAVVGGSDSAVGSGAGRDIDACEAVIRVHGQSGDLLDYGQRCDYIFSDDPEQINAAASVWPEAQIVAATWPMPPILKTVCTLGVTPGVLNSARATSGLRDCTSTGFRAVFWALANGADKVLLAGFGGSDHRGTIQDDFDKIWRDYEDAALDRLAKEGLVQWLD